MKRILIFAVLSSIAFRLIGVSAGQEKAKDNNLFIYHSSREERYGFIIWDCPVFAAYADGTIIWRKAWSPSLAALSVTDVAHGKAVIERIETMMSHYGGKTFFVTKSSDQPTTTIQWHGKPLTIVGDWEKPLVYHATEATVEEAKSAARMNRAEQELWSALPAEIRQVLFEVQGFDVADAKHWQPERLLFQLEPPINTDKLAIEWPSRWTQTFARVGRSTRFLVLPGAMLEELLNTFPDDGEPKLVRLGGETSYAELRVIVPGDPNVAWTENPGSGQDIGTP